MPKHPKTNDAIKHIATFVCVVMVINVQPLINIISTRDKFPLGKIITHNSLPLRKRCASMVSPPPRFLLERCALNGHPTPSRWSFHSGALTLFSYIHAFSFITYNRYRYTPYMSASSQSSSSDFMDSIDRFSIHLSTSSESNAFISAAAASK